MDVVTTREFDRWLTRLRDREARAAILARIRRIEVHGCLVGDFKPLGDGLTELRFDMGPGYRVYLTEHAGALVVLLAGGTKGGQRSDIARARRLASEWRDQHGRDEPL